MQLKLAIVCSLILAALMPFLTADQHQPEDNIIEIEPESTGSPMPDKLDLAEVKPLVEISFLSTQTPDVVDPIRPIEVNAANQMVDMPPIESTMLTVTEFAEAAEMLLPNELPKPTTDGVAEDNIRPIDVSVSNTIDDAPSTKPTTPMIVEITEADVAPPIEQPKPTIAVEKPPELAADPIRPISVSVSNDIGDYQADAPEVMPTEHAVTPPEPPKPVAVATTTQYNTVSAIHECYSCNSAEHKNCIEKPTTLIKCNPLHSETQAGCYTLLRVETNISTRGCIDELTDDGYNFCKQHQKTCTLCYETGCNDRMAPVAAGAAVNGIDMFCYSVALLCTIVLALNNNKCT